MDKVLETHGHVTLYNGDMLFGRGCEGGGGYLRNIIFLLQVIMNLYIFCHFIIIQRPEASLPTPLALFLPSYLKPLLCDFAQPLTYTVETIHDKKSEISDFFSLNKGVLALAAAVFTVCGLHGTISIC